METKYIFVTGGVVSGLGKGITAASLGRLLKNRGYKVANQKFDPYINIDPGTMSPYEHGEVFVTDDGAETDLDLGHYERFTDESLTKNSSITTGRIYSEAMEKEGLKISGTSPDGNLVEIVELDKKLHPFFIAGQFHPEFKSRPDRPQPLFVGLIFSEKKQKM